MYIWFDGKNEFLTVSRASLAVPQIVLLLFQDISEFFSVFVTLAISNQFVYYYFFISLVEKKCFKKVELCLKI